MSKHGKKYSKAREALSGRGTLSLSAALEQVKGLAFASFDESVDVDINLGVDASRGDQNVRGSVMLPHSRGEQPIVIVFAKGDYVDRAQAAGADHVGLDELIEKIQGGWCEFDYAVATPDVMASVGKVARVLGPKGLLPNKKLGTVTFDIESIVADLKKGRAFFKNDKGGSVHFAIGKLSFSASNLEENFRAFTKALLAAKPASSKGKYVRKVTVTSTMGVGVSVSPEEIL